MGPETTPTPSPVPAIARLARGDEDPEVRAAAIDTLARIGGEAAVAALVALAGDPRHAEAAVAALAGMDGAQAEWIARGLQHPDVGTRCATAEALGRLRVGGRDGAVARLLARALDDEAEVVRLAVAGALERLDLRAAEGEDDADAHPAGRAR